MDALYDVLEAFVAFQESGPSLLVILVVSALVALPLTLLHEVGHALAARRVLGTGVEVKVGNAGKLAEFELGEIRVQLNAWTPWAGPAGHAAFDDSRARARDISPARPRRSDSRSP